MSRNPIEGNPHFLKPLSWSFPFGSAFPVFFPAWASAFALSKKLKGFIKSPPIKNQIACDLVVL